MALIRQIVDILLANYVSTSLQQKGSTTTAKYRNEAIDKGETSDTD
jgi:hypothetical protein